MLRVLQLSLTPLMGQPALKLSTTNRPTKLRSPKDPKDTSWGCVGPECDGRLLSLLLLPILLLPTTYLTKALSRRTSSSEPHSRAGKRDMG